MASSTDILRTTALGSLPYLTSFCLLFLEFLSLKKVILKPFRNQTRDQSPQILPTFGASSQDRTKDILGLWPRTQMEAPGPKLLAPFLSPVLITSFYILSVDKIGLKRVSSIFEVHLHGNTSNFCC